MGCSWGWNQHAVLDVKSFDFSDWGADELGDDGEDFGGVDGQARSVEGLVTETVWVPVTSIWVCGPAYLLVEYVPPQAFV